MKNIVIAILALAAATLSLAETATNKPQTSSRVQLHSAAKQSAAGVSAAERALTPEQLAIADQIHLGRLPCELGSYVQIDADPKAPGFFNVQTKTSKYRMFPVVAATGAIRLEDHKIGAVWLQLANKSMLMNQRLGQRLADECMSPAQHAVAEALKTNPAPSFMEPAPAAVAKISK
jgi:hypothetical protein